jgi:hypothetical protein
MKIYKLIAFASNGEKLIDESFEAEAEADELAKEIGLTILNEKDLSEKSYRCTSSSGNLILFHS